MKTRITGLETEYAIKYYPDLKTEQSKVALTERELFDILSGILEKKEFEKLYDDPNYRSRYTELFGNGVKIEVPIINRPMMFMSNGSRFYMDTGFHPEYATPECTNARDILIYDRAGESLLEDLLLITEKKIREQDFMGAIFISKNNVDINGNTYGCHENYLVARRVKGYDEDKFFHYLVENLVPFLATRLIYAGAGKILTGEQIHYQISQRADYINSEISSTTTSNRGIINSRDETLGNSLKYRRLHIIIGDSNMADIPTFLKIGTTCIVLRMIEDLFLNIDFKFENSVAVLRQISHDLSFSVPLQMKNGSRATALDIQYNYLAAAKKYMTKRDVKFSDVDMLVIKLWEEILEDLRNNSSALHTKLDWAAKKQIIDRYLEKNGLSHKDLAKWSFIINNIKKRNLEKRINIIRLNNPSFDLKSFLKENILEVEYNHIMMYLNEYKINLKDYFKMQDIYYRVIERDIRYHDIRQDKGIFFLLRKQGIMKNVLNSKDMVKVIGAKTNPPKNTRAKLRSQFILYLNEKGLKGEANWDTLTFLNGEKEVIEIGSPFKTTHKRMKEIINSRISLNP
ncbi:proteasome accessory factor PafA2 family protein [bacterium]|nr:proteasome accessory factor PafA2 family protein [bacterium]